MRCQALFTPRRGETLALSVRQAHQRRKSVPVLVVLETVGRFGGSWRMPRGYRLYFAWVDWWDGSVATDDLQLMAPPNPLSLKREYDRVTFVSDALRTLARETGTLVVAAAQLRRPDRERATPRPTLEDLRNSDAIEQDSDEVVLIYHDRPGWADLGLAKHRNGPTGSVNVRWVGSRMRFDAADPA